MFRDSEEDLTLKPGIPCRPIQYPYVSLSDTLLLYLKENKDQAVIHHGVGEQLVTRKASLFASLFSLFLSFSVFTFMDGRIYKRRDDGPSM